MSDALHEAALKLNPLIGLVHTEVGSSIIDYAGATEEYGYVRAKEEFSEYRRFLQVLGTEVGRDMFGEDVWVDLMADKIEKLHAEGKNVVVTGIRFPNEVDLIKRLGVAMWVKRPPLTATDAVSTHASENSVTEEDFDYVLFNNKTLPELYTAVDGFVANTIYGE